MEQIIAACLSMAQTYADKRFSATLTEYEVLLYEQCCRLSQVYLRTLENSIKAGLIKQEKDLDALQAEEERLKEKGGGDGEATSVDQK